MALLSSMFLSAVLLPPASYASSHVGRPLWSIGGSSPVFQTSCEQRRGEGERGGGDSLTLTDLADSAYNEAELGVDRP